MSILNITGVSSSNCTVDINPDQIDILTLDFVKGKVRKVLGVNNFNLFIPGQENPINSDQKIRDTLSNQADENNCINE